MIAREVWPELSLQSDGTVSQNAANRFIDRELFALPVVPGESEAAFMDATEESVSERNYCMEMIHLYHDLLHELHRKMTELSARLGGLALHTGRFETILGTMECFLDHMEQRIGDLEQKLAGVARLLEQLGLQPQEPHMNSRFTARL